MINNTALINLMNDATARERISILKTVLDYVNTDFSYDETDEADEEGSLELARLLSSAEKAIEEVYGE